MAELSSGLQLLRLASHHIGCFAMTQDPTNFEANVKLWDSYASNWLVSAPWVKKMKQHVSKPTDTVMLECTSKTNFSSTANRIECVGEEWSTWEALRSVVELWIFPIIKQLPADMAAVCDLGCGGGRVSQHLLPHVKHLVCCDSSRQMLERAKQSSRGWTRQDTKLEFVHLSHASMLAETFQHKFDFLVAFDVFPHLDLHTLWHLLLQIRVCLKKNGKVFLSFADITTPGGWGRFVQQERQSLRGFYFLCPEIVFQLLHHCGFIIIKTSIENRELQGVTMGENDMYAYRDLLVVAENPECCTISSLLNSTALPFYSRKFQEAEEHLLLVSKFKDNAYWNTVVALNEVLTDFLPSNFSKNCAFWEEYSINWDTEADWVIQLGRSFMNPIGSIVLEELGDEWLEPKFVEDIMTFWIKPYLKLSEAIDGHIVAADIGCGAGRFSVQMLPLVDVLVCYEVSRAMLSRAKKALAKKCQQTGKCFKESVQFNLLNSPEFPVTHSSRYHIITMLDVLPFFDLHMIWNALQQMRDLLKVGGYAIFSFVDIAYFESFNLFCHQAYSSLAGFSFVSMEQIKHLMVKCKLKLVSHSSLCKNEYHQCEGYQIAFVTGNPFEAYQTIVVAQKCH